MRAHAALDLNRVFSRIQSESEDVTTDSTASDDSGSVIREAVRQLPQRQRDALFLRYYLDFDYRAIAEVLDVEVGTISATLHAARNSLMDALQEVRR